MTNTITSKSAAMYTKAKKILGYWTVCLESNGLAQFKSLSRKKANEWRDANEPAPALNEALGVSVWRNREAMPA